MGPFAGLRREMSELHAALAGGSRLVLVAGDAGIGKTRFVTEGLRGTRSAWGACLPLAEKLPFLPVTEALDALSRVEDGALLASALAAIPAYAQAEAVRLLPRLQPPDAGPRGGQRERMFSGVTDAAEVARRGLASARQAGLEAFWTTAILAGNGAEALLYQGRTAAAAALIGPLTDGPAGRDTWIAHVHRAELDLLSGDAPAAIARQEQIAATVGRVGSDDWSREGALRAAELRLWTGAPDRVLLI